MNKPRAGAVLVFRHGPAGLELAVGRRLGDPEKGEWGYPGGGINDEENPRDGAARELLEEAGVRVDPSTMTYIITQQNTHEVHIYAEIVDKTTELKSGDDMADMQWMKVNQLPRLAFNGNRYVEKAIRKMKLGEGAMIPDGKMTVAESIARQITEDPDVFCEYEIPQQLMPEQEGPQWDSIDGSFESANSYNLQVKLVHQDPEHGHYNVVGTIRNTPVKGMITLFADGTEYAGWDWQGSPNLEGQDELIQTILDIFEPLFDN